MLCDQFVDAACAVCDRGVVEWVVSWWSEPAAELTQSEQDRAAADVVLVAGGQGLHSLVAAQQGGKQDGRVGFLVVEMEVAQVEQRFGAPDLPEVDQAGVAAADAKYWCQVEVAVRQDRRCPPTGSLMFEEIFEDG